VSKRRKISERDLGEAVIAWLDKMGWDIYQEVQPDRFAGRAE